ncbi:MAG: glycosyltransferase [Bacteroidetes bacterium]|nr:glycosyltransferase [Bacteroidota bacterium]
MMEDLLSPGTLMFYVFLLYSFVTLIQLGYYWGIFSRLAFFKKKQKRNDYQPVSVVICARNEYYNLKKYLPQFLDQKYENFEVVVVNDSSDDETDYLLKTFTDLYPNLTVVHFRQNLNFFKGKKFPLSLGIKSAKNEIILLTDADCRPNSPFWIREMQSNFFNDTDIVLGYGKYETRKGFLNKLIRFDTLFIAIQYFSYTLAGLPYMGVGRNLSYRKSVFYKSGGFVSHYQIPSGDDDLFVNQVANPENIRIEVIPESHTISTVKTSYNSWYKQKKRHLTTGRYYKIRHKFMLSLFVVTQFLFYGFFILLIASGFNFLFPLTLFILRLASALFIFKKCMRRLDEKNLLLYLPVFELFFLFFNPLLSLSASIFKEDKWK